MDTGHIIPKVLSEYFEPFKYDDCLFQSYKAKQKTARVYFGRKYEVNAITFEQSYGFIDKQLIGIKDWYLFGSVLIDVLLLYSKQYMNQD